MYGRDPLGIPSRIKREEGICHTRSMSVRRKSHLSALQVHIRQRENHLVCHPTPLVKKGSLSSAERNPICSKKCLDKGNRSIIRYADQGA